MSDPKKILSSAAVEAHLESLAPWVLRDGCLVREDQSKDFRQALAWINRVGMLAEEHNHHPDFHLTDWNRVALHLRSHDVDGITDRDLRLARAVNDLAAK